MYYTVHQMRSRSHTVDGVTYLTFNCAGCGSLHQLPVRRPPGDPRVTWTWNEEFDLISLTPSVKTTWRALDTERICHFILTRGVQAFCSDDSAVPNQHLPVPELEHGVD